MSSHGTAREVWETIEAITEIPGLTQEQLAERVELSVEMVSFMERGIHAPSFESLEKLAEVFRVRVQYLFVFDEDAEVLQPANKAER